MTRCMHHWCIVGKCLQKETPVFVLYWNVLINVVKWWPWADKRWSLLPGDQASYCQHQLQTVRLLCILHRLLTEDLISASLALMRVFIFVQGQLSERMEAVVHPDGFPSLLWCYEAISVEVSAGRLCQPHDALPRWTIHQQPNTSRSSSLTLFFATVDLSVDRPLLLIDRYRQGMWAESKEDFSVWGTHTVSQQHGTQSYAG